MKTIFLPTIKVMNAEGRTFKGCLYFGLMLTKDGPKVIEYNCRFGDPETEVVLPKLKSDFVQLTLDVLAHKDVKPEFHEQAFLGVVLAAKGYPGKYGKGFEIRNLESVQQLVFHMGTKQSDGKWLSNGGRVLFVVGQGDSLAEAQKDAYVGVKTIDCPDLFYRSDIGWQAIQ